MKDKDTVRTQFNAQAEKFSAWVGTRDQGILQELFAFVGFSDDDELLDVAWRIQEYRSSSISETANRYSRTGVFGYWDEYKTVAFWLHHSHCQQDVTKRAGTGEANPGKSYPSPFPFPSPKRIIRLSPLATTVSPSNS